MPPCDASSPLHYHLDPCLNGSPTLLREGFTHLPAPWIPDSPIPAMPCHAHALPCLRCCPYPGQAQENERLGANGPWQLGCEIEADATSERCNACLHTWVDGYGVLCRRCCAPPTPLVDQPS